MIFTFQSVVLIFRLGHILESLSLFSWFDPTDHTMYTHVCIYKLDMDATFEEYEEYLKSKNPLILDFLTLTLEEIFIYEMEVLGYEFNEVI